MAETPDRTALFDPGSMSAQSLRAALPQRLDDIYITHSHGDHFDPNLVKELVALFPDVRITAPEDVVRKLADNDIQAFATAPDGAEIFESPHESVEPVFITPQEIGINYLGVLTHPGDSHSFKQTKPILCLPVTAPWGSNVAAVRLALALKPQHILPIHDWHWSDQARISTYDRSEKLFKEHGITFHKLETGVPVTIEV